MRKLMMMLAMAAMSAQAATTAFVGQSIGSIAVQGNGVNTIVAVAFKELSAADECVSVANIVSTEGLDAGDVVSVYWNGGFETWTLAVDAQGVKSWAKNEKKFSVGSDGQVTQSDGQRTPQRLHLQFDEGLGVLGSRQQARVGRRAGDSRRHRLLVWRHWRRGEV